MPANRVCMLGGGTQLVGQLRHKLALIVLAKLAPLI